MHKEIDFETDVEHALISSGGYEEGDPNTYDPEAALFPADVIAFVQKTQPKIWTRLTQLDPARAPAMLLDSLVKELSAKGALSILREGSSALERRCGWRTLLPTPASILRLPNVMRTTA
jgi:type I restriction enzyme R subunit